MFPRALILLLLIQLPVLAEEPADEVRLGQRLRVFVITMERGDAIWERWGHNTLVVQVEREPDRPEAGWGPYEQVRRQLNLSDLEGFEHVYNWGIFDFRQESFFLNFIQGRMWYSMKAEPLWATIVQYQESDRSIWVQEMDLTAAQRGRLARHLDWHGLPENKDYYYDYYIDNCSTRVRDALDVALAGRLAAETRGRPTGRTFRWHTRRLTADAFAWNVTLNALTGQPVDRPIDVWEEMFLPVQMMEHLRTVQVENEAGQLMPLVKREWTLHQSARPPEPAAPPNRAGIHLTIGLMVGGLFFGLGHLSSRRFYSAKWLLGTLVVLWALYTGGLGVILVYGWLFTYHWAGYWNESLMQLNPLAAGLVVLGPMVAFGRARGRRWAVRLAVVVAAVAIFGVIGKALPWFGQDNGEVLALFVPVHLGVAAGLWLVIRGQPRKATERRSDEATKGRKATEGRSDEATKGGNSAPSSLQKPAAKGQKKRQPARK